MKIKCDEKSTIFGHRWKTTYTISGAGRSFTYPLIPNICEKCGEERKEEEKENKTS